MLESVRLSGEGESSETSYEYYPGTSRVSVQHYPDGGDSGAFAVQFCYDAQGRVEEVLDAFRASGCDGQGPPSASFWRRTSSFQGLGVDEFVLGNGVTTAATLDPNTLRIQDQTVAAQNGSVDFSYGYQPGGRIQRETRVGSGAVGEVEFDHVYGYSDGGILSSIADGTSGSSLYDPAFNSGKQLESGIPGLGTFVYEGADASPFGNRLKRVEPPASAPEQAPHIFEYDGRGNQFHRTGPKIPGGEQSISYNIFNLPDTIVTGSGASAFTVAFDYNASGQRVRTIRPDSETWHFGSIYERDERPTDPDIAEEHRYYIFAMGQRVAEVSRARPPLSGAFVESTRYFHYDHRGSVIALSNSSGDITDELDYGTFGEALQAMPTAFGYTSHRHEEGLGLVDAQGRFYDPIFGIFVSADPISPLGGSSPRLNRYAYVGYDPVNFTDPTGFFFKELWNGISWGLDFTWGNFVVAPTNLLLTGRAWNTTWDTDTTEGLITFVAAAAAGLACGLATANPVVGGACAGAVAGGLGH